MCVVDALPAGFTGGCIRVSRCINACGNCWFWRICVRLMRAPTHGVGWILFAFIVLSWWPLLCTSHGNIDFKTSMNICRLWESSSKRRMLTERTLKKKMHCTSSRCCQLQKFFLAFWHLAANIEISCCRSIKPCKFPCKVVMFDSIPKYTIVENRSPPQGGDPLLLLLLLLLLLFWLLPPAAVFSVLQ